MSTRETEKLPADYWDYDVILARQLSYAFPDGVPPHIQQRLAKPKPPAQRLRTQSINVARVVVQQSLEQLAKREIEAAAEGSGRDAALTAQMQRVVIEHRIRKAWMGGAA